MSRGAPATRGPAPEVVRYVVVVHGIGQQRKNESVRPVIQRFAEARSQTGRRLGDPVTLGLLASHLRQAPVGAFDAALEQGWIELEGIPQRPDLGREPPFVGRDAATPGHNLRFVDLHWSTVMDDQFGAFGEDTADWTRSLIDRLEIREAPAWIRDVLHVMRNGVVPLQQLLRRRDPDAAERIFDRFLGDVQLYGEYRATRGMAVRRFHERLAGLEAAHYAAEARTGRAPRDPRFVVIGHSLGSVLSFDALLFAHIRRGGDREALLRLLPEYGRNPSTKDEDARFPALDWIRNVDALVTLGSPIDKFLVMWWLNYAHLVRPGEWADPDVLQARALADGRIAHYNYCDEQDPVGHNLEVAYTPGTVVAQVFDKREDVVYTRYAVPGLAHVGYWSDGDLFRRILDLAVDGRSLAEAAPVAWFRPWVCVQSYAWSYLVVPLVGWAAASAALTWAALAADNWGTRVFWYVVGLTVLLTACWVMRLMVEWREIVVIKGRDAVGVLTPGERGLRAAVQWTFRALVLVIPAVWLYLLIAALAMVPLDGVADPAANARDWVEKATSALWGPPAAVASSAAGALRSGLDWVARHTWPDAFAQAATGLAAKAAAVRWWVPALVASLGGFLIGLWNLIVYGRIHWRYRRASLALDFVEYVRRDPTRPEGAEQ